MLGFVCKMQQINCKVDTSSPNHLLMQYSQFSKFPQYLCVNGDKE